MMNPKDAMKVTLEATDRIGMPPAGKSLVKKFNSDTMIASVGRKQGEATYYLYAEWYVQEAHSDDDASRTGMYLPAKPGSTRRCIDISGADRAELAEKIETAEIK